MGAGFRAAFFAVSEGVAAGVVTPFTAGLTCSAETAPQISNNAKPSASFRMNCGPAPSERPETYHK